MRPFSIHNLFFTLCTRLSPIRRGCIFFQVPTYSTFTSNTSQPRNSNPLCHLRYILASQKKSEDEGEKTKKLLIYFVFFHPNYHLIFAFFLAKNFRIIEKLASANAEERFFFFFSFFRKLRKVELANKGAARGGDSDEGATHFYTDFSI